MQSTRLERAVRELLAMAGGAIAALYFLAHQQPPLWLVAALLLLIVANLVIVRKDQWFKDHPNTFATCLAVGFLAVIAQAAIAGGLRWQAAATAATAVILVWVLSVVVGKRVEHDL